MRSIIRLANSPYAFLFFTMLGMVLIIQNSHIFYSGFDDLSLYIKLSSGDFTWHGISSSARFFPLAGIFLNITSLFSTSPYAFNISNAILFCCVAICFWRIGLKSGASNLLVFVMFSIAVLSPSISHIYTAICYPEAPQIAFLALFFYFSIKFFESLTSAGKKRWVFASLAIISANFALYLKEVTFIIVGGFGFFHILLSAYNLKSFKKISRDIIMFDLLLIVSAIIFLCMYLHFTSNATSNYIENASYLFSKTKIVLVLLSGTPIALALFLAVLYRIYRIFKHGDTPHPFFDALGLVASFYIVGYIILGMSGLYYYTPTVVLGALYFAFFFVVYKDIFKNLTAKILALIFALIFISSSMPLSIHQYTKNKTQNQNVEAGMLFLSEYIKTHGYTELFFDNFARGINPIWEIPAYGSWFNSLKTISGVNNFDVKSHREVVGNFKINPDSPYSFLSKKEVDILGDTDAPGGQLLILSYLGNLTTSNERIKRLKENYELLFVSDAFGYFPAYSLPYIIAEFLDARGIARPLSFRKNLFALPSGFYVFKVK